MSFQWSITPEKAWPPFVQAQVDGFEADLVVMVNEMLPEITQDMQASAPWTDQTGLARRSLFSALIHEARSLVGILISHGSLVDYGVWLEVRWQGRFAIIAPTADKWSVVFFNRVRDLARKRFGG